MELNHTLQKIMDIMNERGWTIYKLAKESDIPYSSLNSMFHKNNQPTLSTLEKICAGFHISLPDFFSDVIPNYAETYCLTEEELLILEMYRSLKRDDKNLLMAYIKGFCQKPLQPNE